jgi:(R,R)-butanediol dehydrogenase / meso-butanediol dehydrogenase / diacetyl reductase
MRMKAIVLEGVRNLQIRDIPAPEPDGFHVILKVESAGICGSDIHHFWENGAPVGLVLGHEFTGTIADAGDSGLAVGDLVVFNEFDPCLKCELCLKGMSQICPEIWKESPGLAPGFNGGYAQYCKVKPHRVYKLPQGVGPDEGALVEPLAITYHAAKLKGKVTGDTKFVLVSGGGAIGVFCALNAKALGAKYVALTEVDTARMEQAKTYPFADEVFNANYPDFREKIMAATGGRGYDTILETSGHWSGLENTIDAIAPGGNYVNVGMNMGFKMPGVTFAMKEAVYTGSSLFTNEEFEEVVEMMGRGKFKEVLSYTRNVPLEAAQESILKAISGNCEVVKFILKPNTLF